MTKKFFTLFFALVASVGTTFAWDYERVQIGDLYYNLVATNQTAEVSRTSSASGDIIIPSTVEYNLVTYSVTSIGENAFEDCSGLTSIEIPNSVTSIGYDAFANCTGLTSIEIPNSVTSIGDWAFEGCSGLTSIEIPNSVTIIDIYAFYACSSLTSVTIPNSVTSIEESAFSGCIGLTSVTIGNSVTSIRINAFKGCSSLTSVMIPNSVTSIGEHIFAECTGLTSVVVEKGNSVYDSRNNCNAIIETATNTLIAGCQNTIIPNSVTSIGHYAFYTCSGLTSVTIPNSVTSIGFHAFAECSSLTSVTIPNSVTSIRDYAFSGCTSLTSVTIPNSVTSIGEGTFSYCSNLTSATIPNSVTRIGHWAFYTCKSLSSIYNYATSPQVIDSDVFGGEEGEEDGIQYGPVDKSTCKLYVPQESINFYKVALVWRDFKNILPIESSDQAIDNTPFTSGEGRGEASKLILHNGQICILRGEKTYTVRGQDVR